MCEKFVYWLKVVFGKLDKHCKCFCVTCPYYEECEKDKGRESLDPAKAVRQRSYSSGRSDDQDWIDELEMFDAIFDDD